MAIRTAVNRALTEITALPTAAALVNGNLTLLTTATADNSATTLTFNSSINSTYDVYLFKFINMHCASADGYFQVNFRDGSTAYDATKTTTKFSTYHQEDNGESSSDRLAYQASGDLAQGTGFQQLSNSTGNAGDENTSGEMFLFNPSSTTFVKHFIARTSSVHDASAEQDHYVAGYCNVTAAIDGVQFKFNSGNIDLGTIKLYGIKDS